MARVGVDAVGIERVVPTEFGDRSRMRGGRDFAKPDVESALDHLVEEGRWPSQKLPERIFGVPAEDPLEAGQGRGTGRFRIQVEGDEDDPIGPTARTDGIRILDVVMGDQGTFFATVGGDEAHHLDVSPERSGGNALTQLIGQREGGFSRSRFLTRLCRLSEQDQEEEPDQEPTQGHADPENAERGELEIATGRKGGGRHGRQANGTRTELFYQLVVNLHRLLASGDGQGGG